MQPLPFACSSGVLLLFACSCIQGVSYFYWRIWPNLRLACKALPRQLQSIWSTLYSNYKTIYRPSEDVMLYELHRRDAHGCPSLNISNRNWGRALAGPFLLLFTRGHFSKWYPKAFPPSSCSSSCLWFSHLTIILCPMGSPPQTLTVRLSMWSKWLSGCGWNHHSSAKKQWSVCRRAVVVMLLLCLPFYSMRS